MSLKKTNLILNASLPSFHDMEYLLECTLDPFDFDLPGF